MVAVTIDDVSVRIIKTIHLILSMIITNGNEKNRKKRNIRGDYVYIQKIYFMLFYLIDFFIFQARIK